MLLLRDALRFPAFCRRAADALATMLRKDADCGNMSNAAS